MRTARPVCRCIASILSIAAFQPAIGQTPEAKSPAPAQVAEWFSHEMTEVAKPFRFGGRSLVWRIDEFNTLSGAEVDRLRAEINGHPEHPKRAVLEEIERQIRDGKVSRRYQLFADGQDRWRFNREITESSFLDITHSPESSWSMSNEAVMIFDPSVVKSSTDPNQSPRLHENIFRPEVDRILYGGVGTAVAARLTPGVPEIHGDRWTIVCSREYAPGKQLAYAYEGRWSSQDNRGYVESLRRVSGDAAVAELGSQEQFSGWSKIEGIDRPCAARIDFKRANGQVWRAVVLEDSDALPPGGFDAVAKPPSIGSIDAIRGEVKARNFANLRTGEASMVGPDGKVGPATVLIPKNPEDVRNTRLRVAGWVVLGVLVIVVLTVRYRRSAT